jgi:hypothetical protein
LRGINWRIFLTLPGKARNQEASRKRLVAELEQAEKYCHQKAEKLAKARAILAACDVETIAQNKKAIWRYPHGPNPKWMSGGFGLG